MQKHPQDNSLNQHRFLLSLVGVSKYTMDKQHPRFQTDSTISYTRISIEKTDQYRTNNNCLFLDPPNAIYTLFGIRSSRSLNNVNSTVGYYWKRKVTDFQCKRSLFKRLLHRTASKRPEISTSYRWTAITVLCSKVWKFRLPRHYLFSVSCEGKIQSHWPQSTLHTLVTIILHLSLTLHGSHESVSSKATTFSRKSCISKCFIQKSNFFHEFYEFFHFFCPNAWDMSGRTKKIRMIQSAIKNHKS